VDRSLPAVSRVENDKFRCLFCTNRDKFPVPSRQWHATNQQDRTLARSASHAPSSTSLLACAFRAMQRPSACQGALTVPVRAQRIP